MKWFGRILCSFGYLLMVFLGYYLFGLFADSAVDSAQVPHLFRSQMDDANIGFIAVAVILMIAGALMAIGSLFGIHDDKFIRRR